MNEQLSFRPQRRPNVIWIFGDQHRAQALSHRGDPNVFTPNIDNLARNGMRFDCAISGAPWCCPFRGALLTGTYPHQNGVSQTPSPLDPSIPTIAQPFNESGYHTAYIGKWHLDGSNNREHYVPPERRGNFHYWMGYENNNNQHECYVYGSDGETPQRLEEYETDGLTSLLLRHLKDHVDGEDYQPFFSVLSVQPPHDPYVPPTHPSSGTRCIHPSDVKLRRNVPDVPWIRERASVDVAGYSAMVENLDYNVGRIRDALKEMHIDRETYLVFFSDHGDMLWSHAQAGKSTPWEESIRVPFIISKVGGRYNTNTGVTDALINHVDIAPTTLGLCGIPVPKEMVGHDYSGHCIHTESPEYRGRPARDAEPDSAYLQQIPRKMHAHTVNKPWRAVLMRDGWKYACTPGQDWMLFNTSDDPYEQANYVNDAAFQSQKERCHNRLAQWIEETDDTFDLPEIGVG
ncbi:MAG: sulfatase [Candidatus Latescibacterota bacterium]|nr:sulfatase [Candidatus Latescibacterota bacterium]